ncbi:MAG: cation diffusion facilitator family transporter, partial [Deltaproteobacteria bacterium]|nr:cation diffusion facilitator family transporter [Deltaproteobacteria bacterium]
MSSGGSKLAVYAAIIGNSLVMVAKFIGFGLTGSAVMFSEAVHSFADVGNQVLLAIGLRKSHRPADTEHPFGYGPDAFVWSLMSAVGIFFLGCGVTLAHGLHTLWKGADHGIEASNIGIAILVFALVVESATLVLAVRAVWNESRQRGIGFVENIRTTDDPFGIAVLLEDSAAVLGVLLALAALVLTQVTHNHYWDAYGTIAIGLLLGVVALFLISRNRGLLLGRAIRPEDREALTTLLENDPAIERVALQRAVVAGVHDYRISAEIDFDGAWIAGQYLEGRDIQALVKGLDSDEAFRDFLKEYGEAVLTQTGKEVDRIEAKIREEIPHAHNIA